MRGIHKFIVIAILVSASADTLFVGGPVAIITPHTDTEFIVQENNSLILQEDGSSGITKEYNVSLTTEGGAILTTEGGVQLIR